MIIHVVRPGESLYSISRIYGLSPNKIAKDNELKYPRHLVIGQSLVIIEGERKHTAATGESIYKIASNYGLSIRDILEANPEITNPSAISAGQIIIIPERTKKFGTIEVNGYSFPEIDMKTLRKTLPNLTYLSIFSYQVMKDGNLKSIDDIPLIEAAREFNVAPIMVITNIEEGKGFNSDIAKAILTNDTAQENLLNNVIQTLKAKNYFGLDIDFEYIYPENREDYNNFLRKTVKRLNDLGYSVTTALAPKTSQDQKGILYEAHDYPVHGALAEHVILMTYEWGYTFSPPMAVAPLNEVVKVLNYAISAIPREKIFMGIPNYGYDWSLPYVKGTMARTVSNTEAVDLAFKEGAIIQYDWKAQAPFFEYYDMNGKQHEVWFEDARSIKAKLETANKYKLGGISYWTITKYFPQNWLILNSLYDVKKII
ncbi:LysM peptidoglycan-binding domain-containing protein [Clostridium ganghwense]|uniref:Glycosyl hydrolase family 18 protein n=1 Tax=Clostridium ganghwense TaxID=312089 RepID=A0ABT4CPN8_9CLOT|nr:LysM peptidoglycan-binding domain-containing protein [Clostridium ganghwense]MCY6371010.1 glycosyl hydrolase family 18 protein [Clostridium ganghwense]